MAELGLNMACSGWRSKPRGQLMANEGSTSAGNGAEVLALLLEPLADEEFASDLARVHEIARLDESVWSED